ncbi:pyridoxal phosphate-dependent transferase [Aspergillus germanicus]
MGSNAEPKYLYQSVTDGPSPPVVTSAEGMYFTLENGLKILDATCGAAVSAIGHGNEQVKNAVIRQLNTVAYCHPGFFQNSPALELADLLIDSTGGRLSRACILGSGLVFPSSVFIIKYAAFDYLFFFLAFFRANIWNNVPGSEAVEAAMKLAYQYFAEQTQGTTADTAQRVNFISRRGSWHGCTIAALSVGDIKSRRTIFEPLLLKNVSKVSPCHPWREMRQGESVEQYVARLKDELEDEFQRLGPETVAAFILEPMVGTALGCVTAAPGYLRAVREVCDRHGALLIFDEIMCGLGRTGAQHAWQHDDVAPDIQTVGKVLGGGYGPVSAVLVNERVINALKRGSGSFAHGQTYQAQPLGCVAALATQRYIKENNLVENAQRMGDYLGEQLKTHLENHPIVGDIRGRGLFWGVELVRDKLTKVPLDPELGLAKRIRARGLEKGYEVCIFSATGAADGWKGDQFLIAPAFTVQKNDVDEIVRRVVKVMESVWKDIQQLALGG